MKPLPQKYQWLNQIAGLPRMIQIAISQHGVTEVVGKGSSETIIAWRDGLNRAGVAIKGYSDDDIPWCGLFLAYIAYQRKENATEVVEAPLWARSWVKYGKSSPLPSLGDVLVFQRGDGGHVGLYIAEDATAYHVIGGNQSNRVCITRIHKSRLIAARRPPYLNPPESAQPYHVTASGVLSKNES